MPVSYNEGQKGLKKKKKGVLPANVNRAVFPGRMSEQDLPFKSIPGVW